MNRLDLKIPPPIVWIIFAVVMRVAAGLAPAWSLALPARQTIAALLAILGLLVSASGALTFHRAHTTTNPRTPDAASRVVSHGPFRFTRNPMYLGLLIVLGAWAVHLSNILAALFLVGFVAYLTAFQIKPEERMLRGKFGVEYEQYLSRVRRWI